MLKRNLTYESAKIYDELPNIIKETKSMHKFKKLLKIHLLKPNNKKVGIKQITLVTSSNRRFVFVYNPSIADWSWSCRS